MIQQKPIKMISRAAMTLLMLVLTATTAWAALDPVTVDGYTFATGSDDEGDYYVVDSKDAFQKLAAYVEGGSDTSGKRFKLTSGIIVSGTMVGTSSHPFCGTFDGGGHTLTYTNSMSTADFCAPFRYVNDATIKDLHVMGTLFTKGLHAGGVVGSIFGGTVRITNCEISTVIGSIHKGGSCHGGLVGYVLHGATLRITGCVFRGILCTGTTTGTISTYCSGFVGSNDGTTTIKNCLYMPNANTPKIVEGRKRISSTPITNGYTFGNGVKNIYNCYYTHTLGKAQGKQRQFIAAGKNVTVGFSGEGTVYDVSGITAYATGMKYENSLIAGASQKVSLTLGHNDPEGKSFFGYSVSNGTLSGTGNPYKLTMPTDDVTVSGEWLELDLSLFGTASGADGTAQHPYTITTTDGLDLLATLVNGGIDFAGKYFELGADIAYTKTVENNYTPIGVADYYFKGTFDGRGHVVSGININRPSDRYQALFGTAVNGALRNITVTDATIIGLKRVGAVVGYASDAYTIENCYYRNVTFGGARDKEGDRVRALQTLTLGENISTSTPVSKTIGGKGYYAEGTTIELSYSGTVLEGQQVTYTVGGELIDGDKFSMPAKDVTVKAQVDFDYTNWWGTGDGSTATTPYVISDASDLNLLAMRTRAGETFAGKYFELGDNIDLSGYYFNGIPANFDGTFDGKGKTISGIDINGTDEAGFFSLVGGTVQNLTLQGKVTISGSKYACVGGIALSVESGGHIIDCQSLLRITGGQNAKKGGVAGSNSGVVHRCLYLGMSSGDEINAVGSGNGASSSTPLYMLESLDSETLEVTNVESTGTIYGGCYHAAGSVLTLTLTATEKEDYTLSGYYYIGKYGYVVPLTDNGNGTYTLTMPQTDVAIEAQYSYTKLAEMMKDGSGRYLVKTMDDLRAVAKASLEDELYGCMGMTFLLDNDIENAGDFSGIAVTPAGSTTNYAFYGTFDGGGHTISGLNIVGDVETVGFIGSLDETYYGQDIVTGTLKNLTLKNCTVTNIYYGNGYVGMLVGSCSGGKLENCRVLGGSVMASSDQDPESEYYIPSSAGAIAGYCILGAGSKDNYYDQKVGVFVDGEPQAPGKCGTGDPDDDLAQALIITLTDNDDNSSDIWTFRGVADAGNGESNGSRKNRGAPDEGEGEGDEVVNVADTPEFLDKRFEVTLTGRTLWKDGAWNTLCLPFALSADEIAASPLAGADIRTLSDASFNDANGTLTLDFTPLSGQGAVSSIEAGKPYIIKWAEPADYVAYNGKNAETCSDIVSPVFEGVTLDATDRSVSFDLDDTEGQEKGITFCGTYDKISFDAAEPSILYLGAGNTLYYPSTARDFNPFRAYFQLDGLSAGAPNGNGVRSFVLNFGDETTAVFDLNNKEEIINNKWYSLDGVRLSGKPTKKGIYIHGGKKVVVK